MCYSRNVCECLDFSMNMLLESSKPLHLRFTEPQSEFSYEVHQEPRAIVSQSPSCKLSKFSAQMSHLFPQQDDYDRSEDTSASLSRSSSASTISSPSSSEIPPLPPSSTSSTSSSFNPLAASASSLLDPQKPLPSSIATSSFQLPSFSSSSPYPPSSYISPFPPTQPFPVPQAPLPQSPFPSQVRPFSPFSVPGSDEKTSSQSILNPPTRSKPYLMGPAATPVNVSTYQYTPNYTQSQFRPQLQHNFQYQPNPFTDQVYRPHLGQSHTSQPSEGIRQVSSEAYEHNQSLQSYSPNSNQSIQPNTSFAKAYERSYQPQVKSYTRSATSDISQMTQVT